MVLVSPGYGELFPIFAVKKLAATPKERTLPVMRYGDKENPWGKQHVDPEYEMDNIIPARAGLGLSPFRTSKVKLMRKDAGNEELVPSTREPLTGFHCDK